LKSLMVKLLNAGVGWCTLVYATPKQRQNIGNRPGPTASGPEQGQHRIDCPVEW